MLLDADHWARFGHEFNPNNERIILYAAMAAELSAKRAISKSATAQARPLVKKLAESKSSTLPTVEFYHTVCLAALGRSYHVEHPTYYTRLQELFEARNKFIHSGVVNLKHSIDLYVETAIHAVKWLRQIAEIQI